MTFFWACPFGPGHPLPIFVVAFAPQRHNKGFPLLSFTQTSAKIHPYFTEAPVRLYQQSEITLNHLLTIKFQKKTKFESLNSNNLSKELKSY